MSVEIYEERLVTRDGSVPDQEYKRHHALVWDEEGGLLDISLLLHDPTHVVLEVKEPDEDGHAVVKASDLARAISDLQRIEGVPWEADSQETLDLRERAAVVVERACHELESNHSPVQAQVASDLRATMLQLIDLASRPA